MRKPLVIAAAVLGLVAAVFGAFVLKRSHDRSSAITAHLDQARSALDDDGKWSKGLEECRAALKLDPDHALALALAGKIELGLGLLKEARADLERAKERAEGVARAAVLLDLGRACADQFRGSNDDFHFRAARDAFQEARSEPTTEAAALDGYATLFMNKGRFQDLDKALELFDELLKKHPDYEAAEKTREVADVLRNRGKKSAPRPAGG